MLSGSITVITAMVWAELYYCYHWYRPGRALLLLSLLSCWQTNCRVSARSRDHESDRLLVPLLLTGPASGLPEGWGRSGDDDVLAFNLVYVPLDKIDVQEDGDDVGRWGRGGGDDIVWGRCSSTLGECSFVGDYVLLLLGSVLLLGIMFFYSWRVFLCWELCSSAFGEWLLRLFQSTLILTTSVLVIDTITDHLH